MAGRLFGAKPMGKESAKVAVGPPETPKPQTNSGATPVATGVQPLAVDVPVTSKPVDLSVTTDDLTETESMDSSVKEQHQQVGYGPEVVDISETNPELDLLPLMGDYTQVLDLMDKPEFKSLSSGSKKRELNGAKKHLANEHAKYQSDLDKSVEDFGQELVDGQKQAAQNTFTSVNRTLDKAIQNLN